MLKEQLEHPISGQFAARIIMMQVQNLTYPDHLHTQYELVLGIEGTIDMVVEGRHYVIHAGDLVFCNAMAMHAYYSTGGSRALMYSIHPTQAPQFNERVSGGRAASCMVSSAIDDRVRMLIHDVNASSNEDDMNLALQTNLLLSRIRDALADVPADEGLTPMHPLLRRAMQFILQTLPGPITLEATAAAAGVSPFHLSHLFNESLGITFSEYVTVMRIDAARRMLVQTGLSVKEISRRCGYANDRTFHRNFLHISGMTPGDYRDIHQQTMFVDYEVPFLYENLSARYGMSQSCP